MKSQARGFLSALLFLGLLISRISGAAQGPDLSIISFDSPGAGTGAGQGTGCFGCTFAINQWGAIAGSVLDDNNVYHGFVRSPQGKYVTFQAPGADTTAQSYNGTVAQGINDLGTVTGYYSDAAGIAHGFIRTAEGHFISFDAPGAAYDSVPVFINLDGSVVGYDLDANLLFHAFLRRADGSYAVFVGPNSCTGGTSVGCYGSEATYVDFWGTTVGGFEDNSGNFVGHGMIRSSSGRFEIFDAPGAGTGLGQGTGCPGCNFGSNIWGFIVGTYVDPTYVYHAFVRAPDGKFTTFDAPGAGTESYQGTGCSSDCPVSLNDFGIITGSYADSNYVQHGYLRSANGKLSTFDPSGSQFTQPESINNAGAITGYYIDANDIFHGFIKLPSR